MNQSSPETGVVGQFGMRMQVRAGLPLCKAACAFLRSEDLVRISHEMK
jgi:hypothetical protein